MFETARFTDNARAVVKTAFRGQQVSTEQRLVAALTQRNRGVGLFLLKEAGITECALPVQGTQIERRLVIKRASEIARQRGVNYVATEHIVMALASLEGSALPTWGASSERLGDILSSAVAAWRKKHPPMARRIGRWCRLVMKWVRRDG
jgi:hypothetical protein